MWTPDEARIALVILHREAKSMFGMKTAHAMGLVWRKNEFSLQGVYSFGLRIAADEQNALVREMIKMTKGISRLDQGTWMQNFGVCTPDTMMERACMKESPLKDFQNENVRVLCAFTPTEEEWQRTRRALFGQGCATLKAQLQEFLTMKRAVDRGQESRVPRMRLLAIGSAIAAAGAVGIYAKGKSNDSKIEAVRLKQVAVKHENKTH